MQEIADYSRRRGWTIGFIPTMGALHSGHLSLVRSAKKENRQCVLSVFVNPLQFSPREDFQRYPRPFHQDRAMAQAHGVDVLFAPTVKELYPYFSGKVGGRAQDTLIEPPPSLTRGLCGGNRPGHFRGVATVVAKLFNAVKPDRAYFGQKDAQQCAVILQMVKDMNWNIRIRTLPIIRESDGLAMSSRNRFLNPAERLAARVLWESLSFCAQRIKRGDRRASALRQAITAVIRREPLARLEYVEVVDAETLVPIKFVAGKTLVAIAVWIGRTRLIDNRFFRVI